jgi:hypothetical protein
MSRVCLLLCSTTTSKTLFRMLSLLFRLIQSQSSDSWSKTVRLSTGLMRSSARKHRRWASKRVRGSYNWTSTLSLRNKSSSCRSQKKNELCTFRVSTRSAMWYLTKSRAMSAKSPSKSGKSKTKQVQSHQDRLLSLSPPSATNVTLKD